MKAVIFTSNSIRHKFVSNTIVQNVDEALVVTECKPLISEEEKNMNPEIKKHFALRDKTEREVFAGNDYFLSSTVPIIYKEVNSPYVYEVVKAFNPDVMFCFGAAMVKEPLLSLLPPGRFINLHLGLSPYYRGSGTNFWPFVNNELEFLGSTMLYIDSGVDTGDILCHVTVPIKSGDTVHSVGCRIIAESAKAFIKIISKLKAGEELPRMKQWEVSDFRYYRVNDFDEGALQKYYQNLSDGMVEKFVANPKTTPRLIIL